MTSASNASGGVNLAGAVRDWLALARLPFHSVGILPFVLGTVLAVRDGAAFSADLFAAGLVVVVGVMLATYLLGEVFDFEGDRLSAQMERNRFSGGSQVLQSGRVGRDRPYRVALAAVVVVAVAGAYVVLATRQWLLLGLGLFGLVAGVFYSVRPFRWSARGIGEVLIGVCYGWLPVAVAYRMQAGSVPLPVTLISVPVGLTIFNVIFVNEFPDFPADRLVGKRTLVVRMGRRGASFLYAAVALLAGGSLLALVGAYSGGSAAAWAAGGVLALLAGGLAAAMLAGAWRHPPALEKVCALSIVLNLATTAALMLLKP